MRGCLIIAPCGCQRYNGELAKRCAAHAAAASSGGLVPVAELDEWKRKQRGGKVSEHKGWVGVDLDSTMATYDGWKDAAHIGAPVPLMVERVKAWLALGIEVRVLTARVCSANPAIDRALAREAIHNWTLEQFGVALHATSEKDYGMIELWDDRVVAVEPNTGRPLNPSRAGLP